MSPKSMSHETWYLLIHRIPARPLYLRARIRALLVRAGAVALKNSVYALPKRPGALERLQSVTEEIRRGGGEAFVCESHFASAEDEAALVESFRELRAADYRHVVDSAEALNATLDAGRRGSGGAAQGGRLTKLERRLEWIRSVDFFAGAGAERPGVKEAVASIRGLARRLAESGDAPAATAARPAGRTWVTRRGVHVDRIACAWFIRRFIDPRARFRFAASGHGALRPGEHGFDMPGGEFSHEGRRCSLETLIAKTGNTDPALERIAGIVHDIDLKDGVFGHPETAGVERLLNGIVAAHPGDEARLERGAMLFDDLYHSFRKPVTFPTSRARATPRARPPKRTKRPS